MIFLYFTLFCKIKVTSEERKGAEIDYLKRFGPAWVKFGGSQDPSKSNPTTDFIKTHPRFEHLVSGWYHLGLIGS